MEELQIVGRYEALRRMLLTEPYAHYLDRPLAYWALPTDRRLPLALLGRKLKDLLNTPFAELAATPGIGHKKIRSFVRLLARVANTDPAELPVPLTVSLDSPPSPSIQLDFSNGFDPTAVSEVVWAQWRASVLKHGLQKEVLGRFAPSLRRLTRVIWNVPMEAYTKLTLDEIRSKRTHGEKRINAILEVFHCVHTLVSQMNSVDHLVIRIVPRRVDQVDTWIGHALQTPSTPRSTELLVNFVEPLLEQIRIDATQQIANLAEHRLGIHGPITSIRQAARTTGLTRARVYQLLNEINDIMTVRWPTGRHLTHELRDKLLGETSEMENSPDLQQYLAAVELFYPGNRRGAAGPLERELNPDDDPAESRPLQTVELMANAGI